MNGLCCKQKVTLPLLSWWLIACFIFLGSTVEAKPQENKNLLMNMASDNLMSYWGFDEKPGGNTVLDQSTYGNDGIMKEMNAKNIGVAGRVGSALKFDGTSGYVKVESRNSLDNWNSMTIALWINPQGSSVDSYTAICGTGLGHRSIAGFFALYTSTSPNHLIARITRKSGFSECSISRCFEMGEWVHVALKWDGKKMYLYKNGVQQGTIGTYSGIVTDSKNMFGIGCVPDRSYRFNGKLDDLRLYNKALSDNQIMALYRLGEK